MYILFIISLIVSTYAYPWQLWKWLYNDKTILVLEIIFVNSCVFYKSTGIWKMNIISNEQYC